MITSTRRLRPPWWVALLLFCLPLYAVDLERAQQLFTKGEYDRCATEAIEGAREDRRDEEWPLLLLRALAARGRFPEAATAADQALNRFYYSVRLRWAAHHVLRSGGNPKRARELLEEINQLAGSRLWAYRQPANLVALGQAALLLGADPKQVLDHFYDAARKADPQLRDSYLASGQLALDKHDFALAAKTFEQGLKANPADPELLCGLAQAHASGERSRMRDFLAQALEINPNHVPSLVLLADHLVDSEALDEADQTLQRALQVNPWEPQVWALRAVIAHLRGQPKGEDRSRQWALWHWDNNPQVDFWIGRKLSQRYRFKEGAAYQRLALAFDPAFLPAKIQLSQDLLRLGRETEGWQLADEVQRQDAYDVMAYNLTTLHETLAHFQTLTNEHFILRISSKEAPVYGAEALDLLNSAHAKLTAKYQVQLDQPTLVEIFPEQKDFGVRTFGMPENPGFLGVCFGPVITANSPASQTAHPANWQAVLWHEFAHVVTLTLTRNKMPRWLSEGISVYEELQANPTWGQPMDPDYRQRIVDGRTTPVADLSAAFLKAKNGSDLQFAYFQSGLVVEFLVERHGFPALRAILLDLGRDLPINTALAQHTASLDKLQEEFTSFARTRALQLAPGLDFSKAVDLPADRAQTNFYKLLTSAQQFIEAKQWEKAKPPLQTLLNLFPSHTSSGTPYAALALAHQTLSESEEERQVLTQWAVRSSDALPAYLRLLELESSAGAWANVLTNAQRLLAVNPLLPAPHASLAHAAEQLDQTDLAIAAYRRLLALESPDPAATHFRLASLLAKQGDPSAKRQVLRALEEAPRFREAHRLLLQLAPAPASVPSSLPMPN